MPNLDELFHKEFIVPERGHGVVLIRDLKKSNSDLSEEPLFSYVHYYSRKLALVCDKCFRSIGSLVDNLNHVLKIDRKCIPDVLEDEMYFLSTEFPEIEGVEYIKCSPECDFNFCSENCLDESEYFHSILCKLMNNQEKEKWKMFRRFSIIKHENFYFAGLIYVHILHDSLYKNKPSKIWINKLCDFWSVPWLVYSQYFPSRHNLFKSEEGSAKAFEVAQDSFNMMESCLKRFKETAILTDEYIKTLFSMEFYLRILGTMDLVCVNIEIKNPWNEMLFKLKNDVSGKFFMESLTKDLEDVHKIIKSAKKTDKTVNELIQSKRLLPNIIGKGIFDFLSMMNHSCKPNFEVEYDLNKIAKIIPLEDIQKGEEATISYINENDTYEKRQNKLLKNYGFKCKCSKCTLEGSNNNL